MPYTQSCEIAMKYYEDIATFQIDIPARELDLELFLYKLTADQRGVDLENPKLHRVSIAIC